MSRAIAAVLVLALWVGARAVPTWLSSCAGSSGNITVCQTPDEPVAVQGGRTLVLENVVLPASTVLTTTNSTSNDTMSLSQLLALPGVVELVDNTAQLVLTNVTVQCSCSWLEQLQQAACRDLSWQQLAPWQVLMCHTARCPGRNSSSEQQDTPSQPTHRWM
ncbi:hypothetical protein HaLaN_31588 [Haematococcus lacustris]|uniref:Uncharacterized protein n=1 Tax=Haematococcus lacustris TaxID=44745 RepID=A0A6A0AIE0_HAELA|nr:hypothetical protein HaLaN_31588 [Haematococcus lacustris]